MMQSEIQGSCLRVSGSVSIRTLDQAACKTFRQQCRQPEIDTLDFSAVDYADSACIALLLLVLRERESSLKLTGLPESVKALAQLYEIEKWLDV